MSKHKLQILNPAHGPLVYVSTQAKFPFVTTEMRDPDGALIASAELTPEQARVLAQWLTRAACKAELAAPEPKVR